MPDILSHMANTFVRYGLEWDKSQFNDLEVELYCYRTGRDTTRGGLGKFGHFKQIVDMLWNNPAAPANRNFVWNDWSERMIRSACENKLVAWAGCASSGKSDAAAMFAIVEYISDPRHTLVIVTSTTLTGARQRIWKSIDQLWNAVPGLPGKMVASVGRIKGVNLDGHTHGDATGIFLLASEKKREKDALGKLIGIKATKSEENPEGRLILIADELPELPESLVHAAFTNLWANEGFRMIALGNPASQTDAFGLVCKPADGWDSVTEDDYEWKTARGVCLRFDASQSPRILGDTRCTWMYSQENIDAIVNDYGQKSVYYYRMVKGYWAPQGSVGTLFAISDLYKHGTGKAVWGERPPIILAALDPSFTHGGDRTVLYFGAFGEDPKGKQQLEFRESIVLMEDLSLTQAGKTRTEQIIEQVLAHCRPRGVIAKHFIYDAGASGSFGDSLSTALGRDILGVMFGGGATDRPVTLTDATPAKDRYGNRVSEMWAVSRVLLLGGHLFGMDTALVSEVAKRRLAPNVGANHVKVRLESKADFKNREGFSPDLADAAFLLVDLCRERFGFRSEASRHRDGLALTGRRPHNTHVFVQPTVPSNEGVTFGGCMGGVNIDDY